MAESGDNQFDTTEDSQAESQKTVCGTARSQETHNAGTACAVFEAAIQPEPSDRNLDACPLCSRDFDSFMILCDYCKQWYHGRCVDVEERDADFIEDYYCKKCLDSRSFLKITLKDPSVVHRMHQQQEAAARLLTTGRDPSADSYGPLMRSSTILHSGSAVNEHRTPPQSSNVRRLPKMSVSAVMETVRASPCEQLVAMDTSHHPQEGARIRKKKKSKLRVLLRRQSCATVNPGKTSSEPRTNVDKVDLGMAWKVKTMVKTMSNSTALQSGYKRKPHKTPEQRRVLLASFDINRPPRGDLLSRLSLETGLEKKVITQWHNNEVQKRKKNGEQCSRTPNVKRIAERNLLGSKPVFRIGESLDAVQKIQKHNGKNKSVPAVQKNRQQRTATGCSAPSPGTSTGTEWESVDNVTEASEAADECDPEEYLNHQQLPLDEQDFVPTIIDDTFMRQEWLQPFLAAAQLNDPSCTPEVLAARMADLDLQKQCRMAFRVAFSNERE
ncbi:uncharacterized protein LOC129581078 isoform X2 [Paramacrobiotus metropolitanus]|uniref:uncharacterized protein LOC129581078 isoform X2 n=1 Tax=Paramacrobiotus metropolitanus TaxID=2943436 RepID=UPI0024465520|nr:uncharacterized protein LOC129581078 isoform X2 [Paramacrobiotus metropolitanus]